MAAADAAIDSEVVADLELSRQLDRAALDDRRDAKHLRKLQWQRAYYQAHKETILRQNRESRERTGYKPVRDKEREKARMRDSYERNKSKWVASTAKRMERRRTDKEFRDRDNARRRELYHKKKEVDPNGISEQH